MNTRPKCERCDVWGKRVSGGDLIAGRNPEHARRVGLRRRGVERLGKHGERVHWRATVVGTGAGFVQTTVHVDMKAGRRADDDADTFGADRDHPCACRRRTHSGTAYGASGALDEYLDVSRTVVLEADP
eukprot:7382982-Prymnesium_polylepis.1